MGLTMGIELAHLAPVLAALTVLASGLALAGRATESDRRAVAPSLPGLSLADPARPLAPYRRLRRAPRR